MNKGNWKVYGFWIAVCEAVGFLSGWLSRDGIEMYNTTAAKPPIAPPAWVFPVVWVVLFALMGISSARVSLTPASNVRSRGLNLFTAQLIINFFWPLLFFNAQAFGFALIWLLILWVLVVAVIWIFWKIDHTAAWLLSPYLIWLTFAAVLNELVWLMNA